LTPGLRDESEVGLVSPDRRADHSGVAELDEAEVLEANASFYRTFRRRDFAGMDALWSRSSLVACAHPGWPVLYGREEVIASWKAILANPESPRVDHDEPRVLAHGELAVVICTERVGETELVATNAFAREDGAWRMIHHQAAPFSRRKLPGIRKPGASLN
jgi:ketosteroid isomerase-like protein